MFLKEKKNDGKANAVAHKGKKKQSPFIQPKLKIGKQGDQYEKEADHVADKVVSKADAGGMVQKMGANPEEEVQQKSLAQDISTVQKQEMQEEEQPVQKMGEEEEEAVQAKGEEEAVQMMEEEEAVQTKGEEEEEAVQAKNNGVQEATSGDVEETLRSSKGGGQKMDAETQQEMESAFGADFSNVNIHTDSRAEQMNQDLGAHAFTNGSDIYFNESKYNPNSKEGKHLLAHELTHTIQQRGSKNIPKVQKKGGGCSGTVVRRYHIRNDVPFEFTVPRGCRSVSTFSAKWEFHDSVSCCTGESPYHVDVNGATHTLPAGDTHCGDAEPFPYETGTIRTRSGRQQFHIRANNLNCPGIRLYINITTRIL